jgi:uncharacterized damage-inducible protein DinB
MNFKDHFIHLFRYNDWATKESVLSIKKLNNDPSDKIISIMSHVVAAQQLWYYRVVKTEFPVKPWQIYTLDDCISKSVEITSKWITLLEESDDAGLETRVSYVNTQGKQFENSIKDIVIHIINHSSYHRAQVALYVRDAGDEPALTDYIVYARSAV